MLKQNLGEMLLAANLIDEVQMRVALMEQKRTGRRFGSTLVDLKFIDENVLAAFLSKQIDIPCISLLHVDIPKKVLRRLPAWLARECHAIPVRMEDDRLEVAMADPTDISLIEKMEKETGLVVLPLVAPQSSVDKMVEKLFPDEEGVSTVATDENRETQANDPHFRDLIEELESGDYEARLDRIDENMERIWSLLERLLRKFEALDAKLEGHEQSEARPIVPME